MPNLSWERAEEVGRGGGERKGTYRCKEEADNWLEVGGLGFVESK